MMNERTRNFQGIRLLLLLGIAFMHIQIPIFGQGNLLCTFFFILSGFLYVQPSSLKDYYKKKFFKMFPFYWICIILYYILLHRSINWNILPHIALVHSFVPSPSGESYYFKYIGVSWFLSSLLFCYVVSPFIYPLMRRIRGGQNIIFIALLVLLMVLFRSSKIIPLDYRIWFFYISPFWRLLEYLLGMSLRNLLEGSEQEDFRHSSFWGALIIILYLFAMNLGVSVLYVSLLHLFVIYFIYCYKSKFLDVVLGNKYVVEVAKYGLAMYLSHQFVWYYLYKVVETPRTLSMVLAVIVGFLLGWIYSMVEKFVCRCMKKK